MGGRRINSFLKFVVGCASAGTPVCPFFSRRILCPFVE
jgi:hypothetical protein